MTQTSEKDSMVALINVFTVEPANQQRLVDLLTRATEGSVNRAPGFIASAPSQHRRHKGDHVRPVAQRAGLSGHAAGPRSSAVPRGSTHHRDVGTGDIRNRADFLACRLNVASFALIDFSDHII
jgi:hypothetical protein